MIFSVPYRSLGVFGALSAGDYLVWNWSVAGNHDVAAIISGLSLPMLLVVMVLLAVRAFLGLLNRSTRAQRSGVGANSQRTSHAQSTEDQALAARSSDQPLQNRDSSSRGGKLAA